MKPLKSLWQTQNNSSLRHHRDMKDVQVTSVSISISLLSVANAPHTWPVILLCELLITSQKLQSNTWHCQASLDPFFSGSHKEILVLLKGKTGGQWDLNGQRWGWKLGWSQTNPTVLPVGSHCCPLIYPQILGFGHGELMFWWSHCMHTDPTWLSDGLNARKTGTILGLQRWGITRFQIISLG